MTTTSFEATEQALEVEKTEETVTTSTPMTSSSGETTMYNKKTLATSTTPSTTAQSTSTQSTESQGSNCERDRTASTANRVQLIPDISFVPKTTAPSLETNYLTVTSPKADARTSTAVHQSDNPINARDPTTVSLRETTSFDSAAQSTTILDGTTTIRTTVTTKPQETKSTQFTTSFESQGVTEVDNSSTEKSKETTTQQNQTTSLKTVTASEINTTAQQHVTNTNQPELQVEGSAHGNIGGVRN